MICKTKYQLLLALLFCAQFVWAQPANNACTGAQDLGTLPAAAPCQGATGGLGPVLNFTNLTNVGAQDEFPLTALVSCQTGGDQANPSADVWYSFVPTESQLDISIVGNLSDINVGLYEGTICDSIIPRGCAEGQGNNLQVTFNYLQPGLNYYLQIGGGSLADQGTFDLSISNNQICEGCIILSNLSADPPPLNGTYQAGTSVTFCYNITEYEIVQTNWLHGIVPIFGSGWDLSTLVVTPPASCIGDGFWDWYPSVTGWQTGQVNGPGFFYESNFCPIFAPCDATDPGDNYGDGCNGAVNWSFCWTVSTFPTATCNAGADLSIEIHNYADGESGGWQNFGCAVDPTYYFSAALTCCGSPVMQSSPASCRGGADGVAIAEAVGTSPYDFIWRDSLGNVVSTSIDQLLSDTVYGLRPGTYEVEVTDVTSCVAISTVTVGQLNSSFNLNFSVQDVSCFGGTDGEFTVHADGGNSPYQYAIDGAAFQTDSLFDQLVAATYSIEVSDSIDCRETATVTIGQPAAIVLSETQILPSCAGYADGEIEVVVSSGGTAPFEFSPSAAAQWQQSPTFDSLTAGNYSFDVQDANGCTETITTSLSEPVQLQITAQAYDEACPDSNDGSINLSSSGGTGSTQYAYSADSLNYSVIASLPVEQLSPGNYWVRAEDDNGCQADSFLIIIPASSDSVVITSDSTSCYGDEYADGSINIQAFNNPDYQFSLDGGAFQSDGFFGGVSAGLHAVSWQNGNGCVSSDTVLIYAPAPLIVSIQPDSILLLLGGSQGLFVNVLNASNPAYHWSPSEGLSCNDCPNPVVSTYVPEQFRLRVYSRDANGNYAGCFGEASVFVDVQKAPAVFVPNVFTPNGDQVNEEFRPFTEHLKDVEIRIYNRWGELVFRSNQIDQGWDGTYKGKASNPGVYVYHLHGKFLNDEYFSKKGSVTLVR